MVFWPADIVVGGSATVTFQPLSYTPTGGVEVGDIASGTFTFQPLIYTPTGGVSITGVATVTFNDRGVGDRTWPLPTRAGLGYAATNVATRVYPLPTRAGVALVGTGGTGNRRYRLPTRAGVGEAINSAVGDRVYQLPVRDGSAQIVKARTYPLPVRAGVGIIGVEGIGSRKWFIPVRDGLGAVGHIGVGDRAYALSARAGVGSIVLSGAGVRTWTLPTRSGTGIIGILASGLRVFSLPTRVGLGYTRVPGVGDRVYPLSIRAGEGAISLAEIFSTLAMNVNNMAITEYTAFDFNSGCEFEEGVYLMAGASGIYSFGGNTDNGVDIDAVVLSGITDFESPMLKRVQDAHFGYRTDGAIKFTTVTDETVKRRYEMAGHSKQGVHQARTPLRRSSKGVRAKNWQFGFENVAGSDFDVEDIEIDIFTLARKAR